MTFDRLGKTTVSLASNIPNDGSSNLSTRPPVFGSTRHWAEKLADSRALNVPQSGYPSSINDNHMDADGDEEVDDIDSNFHEDEDDDDDDDHGDDDENEKTAVNNPLDLSSFPQPRKSSALESNLNKVLAHNGKLNSNVMLMGEVYNNAPKTAAVSAYSGSGNNSFVNSSLETLKSNLKRGESIPKKKRTRTTPEQLYILQQAFEEDPMPNAVKRGSLAERLGMNGRAVQIWFQNRRAKGKLDQKKSEQRRSSVSASAIAGVPSAAGRRRGGRSLSVGNSSMLAAHFNSNNNNNGGGSSSSNNNNNHQNNEGSDISEDYLLSFNGNAGIGMAHRASLNGSIINHHRLSLPVSGGQQQTRYSSPSIYDEENPNMYDSCSGTTPDPITNDSPSMLPSNPALITNAHFSSPLSAAIPDSRLLDHESFHGISSYHGRSFSLPGSIFYPYNSDINSNYDNCNSNFDSSCGHNYKSFNSHNKPFGDRGIVSDNNIMNSSANVETETANNNDAEGNLHNTAVSSYGNDSIGGRSEIWADSTCCSGVSTPSVVDELTSSMVLGFTGQSAPVILMNAGGACGGVPPGGDVIEDGLMMVSGGCPVDASWNQSSSASMYFAAAAVNAAQRNYEMEKITANGSNGNIYPSQNTLNSSNGSANGKNESSNTDGGGINAMTSVIGKGELGGVDRTTLPPIRPDEYCQQIGISTCGGSHGQRSATSSLQNHPNNNTNNNIIRGSFLQSQQPANPVFLAAGFSQTSNNGSNSFNGRIKDTPQSSFNHQNTQQQQQQSKSINQQNHQQQIFHHHRQDYQQESQKPFPPQSQSSSSSSSSLSSSPFPFQEQAQAQAQQQHQISPILASGNKESDEELMSKYFVV